LLSKIDKKGSNTLKHFLDSQEFNKQDNYIINGMLAPMIGNDTEWTNWSGDRQEHKIKVLEKDLCNHFYDSTIETKSRSLWSHWSDCLFKIQNQKEHAPLNGNI